MPLCSRHAFLLMAPETIREIPATDLGEPIHR
jgi:hypothetical protein